jgi:hypothetical protein
MNAPRLSRCACSLGALFLLSGCKAKPPAKFVGMCFIGDLKVDGESSVTAVVDLHPNDETNCRPPGTLLLELSEEHGADKDLRCSVQGVVTAASYAKDCTMTVALPFPRSCVGAAPEGGRMSMRTYFKPGNDAEPVWCEGRNVIPPLWGGMTVDQQTAASAALVAADSQPTVVVDVRDALRFPNGKVDEGRKLVRIYAHVPASWLVSGALTPQAKTTLLAKLYGGPSWEKGNFDGSLYIVRSFTSRLLTSEEVTAQIWNREATTAWFYETKPDGTLDKRGPNFGPPQAIPEPVHLDQVH